MAAWYNNPLYLRASTRCPVLTYRHAMSGTDVSTYVYIAWCDPGWFENGTPSKALLDAACPDFPAYLRDMNGHEGWTNSLALKEANIDRTTADPGMEIQTSLSAFGALCEV